MTTDKQKLIYAEKAKLICIGFMFGMAFDQIADLLGRAMW